MMDLSYRTMQVSDIPDVHRIECEIFTSAWSKRMFQMELSRGDIASYIVALDGKKIVGYGGIWLILNEAHITNVAVSPNMQRKGIGGDIVHKLIDIALNIGASDIIDLEVRRSNYPAQRLYRGFGFSTISVRGRYYQDNGEDAFIMAFYPKKTNN